MVRRVGEQHSSITDDGHRELAQRLAGLAGHPPVVPGRIEADSSYTSGGHAYYGVSVPERRALVRTWLRERRDLDASRMLATCDSLISSEVYEEKSLACMILSGHHAARMAVTPEMVDQWLDDLAGWAEVDSLCQNVFTAEQMLSEWPGWRALIQQLSGDANINKRRAALVLLTGPVHYSTDARLSELAFETVDALSHERAILITKAVSWLLRSLADNHATAVAEYIEREQSRLPAIALRETRVKLMTGTKRGRTRVEWLHGEH